MICGFIYLGVGMSFFQWNFLFLIICTLFVHIFFKENVKVYFYVVVPHTKYYNSYVFLFMPHTIIPLNNYGWRSAKHSEIDKISGIDEFHLGYKEIIEPFLENIFNNKNSK